MTQQPSQAAQAARPDPPQPAVSVNGAGPGQAAPEECDNCASTGEKSLAVIGVLIGLGIIVIAIDVGTGYRLSRAIGLGPKPAQEAPSDSGS